MATVEKKKPVKDNSSAVDVNLLQGNTEGQPAASNALHGQGGNTFQGSGQSNALGSDPGGKTNEQTGSVSYGNTDGSVANGAHPGGQSGTGGAPYNGLPGLSTETANALGQFMVGYTPGDRVNEAYNQMNNYANGYTASDYVNELGNQVAGFAEGYKPSENVINALNALQALDNSKPGEYNSRYQDQLDQLLQQIINPEKFQYSFNGDELFKMYADEYTQRGKQAMEDTMGRAAALTGGYGNSYAQTAGQQAYQQQLTQLYDKGLELRDRAYQMYLDQLGNNQAAYNALSAAEGQDYNRWRDTVSDWERERDYRTGRYETESANDYNRWNNDRNYWTDRYDTEYANDFNRWAGDRTFWMQMANAENGQSQFDTTSEMNQTNANHNYYGQLAVQMAQNGQMPSAELLALAGLTEADIQALMPQQTPSGGGSPSRPRPQPEQPEQPVSMQFTPEEWEEYLRIHRVGGNNPTMANNTQQTR